jgi:SAP domain
MRACLSGRAVPQSSRDISDLVDHRCFYDGFNPTRKLLMGYYTCGLSRNAVAVSLLTNKVHFAEDFLRSLPQYISNQSVAGFMIEQAVLSSIALNGLNVKREINRPMEVVLFQDIPRIYSNTKEPVLYLPRVFNFRAIDGIIIWIGPKPKTQRKKRELFLFPLQITLAPDKHSDSHKIFFSDWESWTEGLQDFDVVPEFVWISPKGAETKEHRRSPEWPAHVERNVPIHQVSKETWNLYNEAKRHQPIREAPEILASEQGGSEKPEGSEEPERPVEHAGSDGLSAATRPNVRKTRGRGGKGSGGREDRRKDYMNMKNAELEALLRSRSLPCSGKKADRVTRLLENDKNKETR